MRKELPCRSGNRTLGRAWYEEQGPRLVFRCGLPGGTGLCKLWLIRGERRLLLGTPAPEGEELTLKRVFSRSMLEHQGVYPPQRVEVTGAEDRHPSEDAVWRPVNQGFPKLADPLLRRLLCQGGWQWRPCGGGLELCHGWGEGMAFPAVPLFCLAQVVRQEHKIQIHLFLDSDGNPQFPPDCNGWEG